MPRPKPLLNLASGRAHSLDYRSLTPRTPHSRSGRAEEAVGDIALEQFDEEDDGIYQHQSEPLLASSASSSFPPSGYRSRGDDDGFDNTHGKRSYLLIMAKRAPLVLGIALACILFVMIILSFKRPDVLLRIIGEANITAGDVEGSISPHPSTSDPNLISYENYTNFPLLPNEYLAECNKLMHGFMHNEAYWQHKPQDVPHRAQIDEHGLPEGYRNAICNSTITYMLDGHGLMAELGLLAQVAALARERNRTFLVDDSYWSRGKWTDHFQDVRSRQPGPEPGCRAPPPEELVACPRTARHWVVNSRTAKYHLGHSFLNTYEDPYAHSLNRWRPIFNTAMESFTETIRPNAQNAALIRSTREEVHNFIANQPPSSNQYISVHLRRGDMHPLSWKYHAGYVPIPEYVKAVQDASSRFLTQTGSVTAVYIASDSPAAEAELVDTLSSNMLLFSLSRSQNPELRALASPNDYVQKEFDKLELAERVNLTRGMVVDFAMLSGMWAWNDDIIPRAIVCTISSSICKLSAVGLGWDRAFGVVDEMGEMDHKMKGWVEIDNAGRIVPSWEAFDLF